MQKEVRKTIRMSEEMADVIERQPGRNFSEKFTHMVFRSQWELPGLNRERDDLTEQIAQAHADLEKLHSLESEITGIALALANVSNAVKEILGKCDSILEGYEPPEPEAEDIPDPDDPEYWDTLPELLEDESREMSDK